MVTGHVNIKKEDSYMTYEEHKTAIQKSSNIIQEVEDIHDNNVASAHRDLCSCGKEAWYVPEHDKDCKFRKLMEEIE